ncbi:uncharacterized protein CXQ87_000277 [Candidozyma duobushaemuli]|uniref:Vacuolar fusion protein MON1 n=1 Tax=Candidozyma duobushaemuli TaxID=1231522 RepID=A0A2V1AI66_9ASCO|nr:uncharacterized protein CXQ87_000277 [[Candida] duobushaemulonis]PVH17392.1 hypothetical protein CXQ87_000277 [[Candida] duobushaemulonis]
MSDNAEERQTVHNEPVLSRQSSIALLPQVSQTPGASVANPTTAVTLENMDQPEITIEDNEGPPSSSPGLRPIRSGVPSIAEEETLEHSQSETEEVASSDNEESETNHLTELLQNLMAHDSGKSRNLGTSSLQPSNIVCDAEGDMDEDFIKSRFIPDKSDSSEVFHHKLKQFFVLSSAGKPIYSLNGSDDTVMGYMGLITTIVSAYQENMKTEFSHITQNGFRLVVQNKSPLILVLISKVAYETGFSSGHSKSTLERQLQSIHTYLVSVLSAPVISRSYERRMNYDLRKILSNQDIAFLDSMSMKMTYGFSVHDNDHFYLDSSFYISHLLGSALRCVRTTHTTRSKISSILLSAKKLTVKETASDTTSIISKASISETKRQLAADLLFGFVSVKEKLLNYVRPSQHELSNEDINMLLAIISFHYGPADHQDSADLWIPLCMPNFNNSGFLYVYVRRFNLNGYDEPLSLILLAANKNSFFDLKQVGSYIIQRIMDNKHLKSALRSELISMGDTTKVIKELHCPFIKHFIYRRKDENQYLMDDINFSTTGEDKFDNLASFLQILYFYTTLHNTKSTTMKQGDGTAKKLTYTRWQRKDGWITGFLLSNKVYDFYCLCGGSVQAHDIIEQSLRIIKWVEKYKKRHFIGKGITF